MSERTPFPSEESLRQIEWIKDAQRYSCDLTQRLTFFVIGIELVFCGYVLLNAQALGAVKNSSHLFLLAGCAAAFGLLWRFFYNMTLHQRTHGETGEGSGIKVKECFSGITYYGYIILSIVFLIFTLYAGYNYLRSIEKKQNNPEIQVETQQTHPHKGSAESNEQGKESND